MYNKETYIYQIWDNLFFQTIGKTASRKDIEIIFQGNRNHFDGPDFKNAIIKMDGNILKGDVEIHIQTTDWNLHKHSNNKSFNSTILHVVYQNDLSTQTTSLEDGSSIEIFILKQHLLELNDQQRDIIFNEKYQPRPHYCPLFARLSSQDIIYTLQDFGFQRVQNKIRKVNANLLTNDFNQLLYEGIFESLGYSQNQSQFNKFAQLLTFQTLANLREKLKTNDDLIALFLGSSSLWDFLSETFPQEKKQKWQVIYTSNFSEFSFNIDWKKHRVRPQNNPALRVMQISFFLYGSLFHGILSQILPIFSASKEHLKISTILKKFHTLISENDFLSDDMKLGKTTSKRILFNIIFPILIIYSKQMGFADFNDALEKLLLFFPKLNDNHILKTMRQKMSETQIKISIKTAIHQQGLHYLFDIGCKEHKCHQCISIALQYFQEQMEEYKS